MTLLSLALGTATIAIAGLIAAPVVAGPPGVIWGGKVERASDLTMGIAVQKLGGQKKVTAAIFQVPLHCTGQSSGYVVIDVSDDLRIRRDGTFGRKRLEDYTVSKSARRGLVTTRMSLEGRLNFKTGIARGTVALTADAPARGEALHCYTGRLEWKARRGAPVDL